MGSVQANCQCPPPEDEETGLRKSIKNFKKVVLETCKGCKKKEQPTFSVGNNAQKEKQSLSGNNAQTLTDHRISKLGKGKGVTDSLGSGNAGKRKLGKGKFLMKRDCLQNCPCPEDVVMKKAVARLRITSPDVNGCIPVFPKGKMGNLQFRIERLEFTPDPDVTDSETSVISGGTPVDEPRMERRPAAELIEAQYCEAGFDDIEDDTSAWSFDLEQKVHPI